MNTKILYILMLVYCVVMASCRKEDDVVIYTHDRNWTEKTVAVVAPLSDPVMKTRLERTAAWFADNFVAAQLFDTSCIDLRIVWYDEDAENIADLGNQLSKDTSVVAVIGPFDNQKAADFAPYCQKTQKPVILPTATSENVVRRFAPPTGNGNRNNKPFLWALTASDTDICETVISYYATYCKYWDAIFSEPQAAVFAPDNIYGKTFTDWIPFHAANLDATITDNVQYSTTEELTTLLHKYLDDEVGQRVSYCVVENAEQLYSVALMRRQFILEFFGEEWNQDPYAEENDAQWSVFENMSRTYFVYNNLCEEYISKAGRKAAEIMQGYQGYSPYADPSTGFEISYENHFGDKPSFAECKFYDALLLAGCATFYMQHCGEADFNDAVIALTTKSEGALGSPVWDAPVMEVYLHGLENGQFFEFLGASGAIRFDTENYTVNTSTTYVQWKISDGKILHTAYFGGDGPHSNDATAAWKYIYDGHKVSNDFDLMDGDDASFNYPELKDKYAVLVQGSYGFGNYRHLADVLSMYQKLRTNGFDDDHILLIVDKGIVSDTKNPEPGVIRAQLGGANLMQDALIDYDAAEISVEKLVQIVESFVPKAADNNVLFYWSGHGRQGEFVWRDLKEEGEGFTSDMLRDLANSLTFRKMLIVAEPCFSESVITSIDGINGVLAIAGAAYNEQSWADNWNYENLFWMSDRFTQNFLTCLDNGNNSVNYQELYLYCTKHTLGSHVKIVNANNFGNLYKETVDEFFTNR